MCVDLRKLNEFFKHDSYQSPGNDDALAWLATKKIRSILDIRWGYHNLRMTKDVQDIMTLTTQLGSYSYLRLPFGLTTAGALFQRYMNRVLDKWLWNEAIAVVDDVAMGSDNVPDHLKLVTEVITVLQGIRVSRPLKHGNWSSCHGSPCRSCQKYAKAHCRCRGPQIALPVIFRHGLVRKKFGP